MRTQDELHQFLHRFAGPQAALLAGAVSQTRTLAKGECLVREGDHPVALSILCQGVAKAFRTMASGTQQTLALYVPGDVLDGKAYVLGRSSLTVCAATPITVAQIPYARLNELVDQFPDIRRWLWRTMATDTAILEEWAVGMGRRSAHQQLAHLLCEVSARMRAAGLVTGQSCALPLTQSDLADVLGLSVVHVNRILQQLRGAELLKLQHGRLTVLNHDRLVLAGDFDIDYLESRLLPVEVTA